MAYERAMAYAQDPQGWLILKGGYGCGKTHLAAAIANYQISQGRMVLFVNTPDLLDHLRATFSPDSTISYDDRFEQVRNAPLLVLDDLGTQSNTNGRRKNSTRSSTIVITTAFRPSSPPIWSWKQLRSACAHAWWTPV
ncbi:MAG: ATP-binding protein [Chloroflexota bacterium]